MKISVILPVYGVAQYIEKCTASLLAQTLDDMEFIYVDDHGPDNSIELVQRMIAGHPREGQFVFLKPPHNMGAGMARNFALPHARGEYIAFVDSDDWVEPTMFQELYQAATAQGHVDLCYCQASKDYLDGRPSEILKNPEVPAGAFTHEARVHFLSHYVSLFWTFLYRKEHLEQQAIRYPEERSADDSYFVTCNLLTAQSIAHVDKPFYHYLIRPGSVCTTRNSTKYRLRMQTFAHLMDFAQEKKVYPEYQAEVDYIYMKKGCISSFFNYIYNSLEPDKAAVAEILAELQQHVPHYRQNTYYKSQFTLRALLGLMQHTPALALKVGAMYVKRANPVV